MFPEPQYASCKQHIQPDWEGSGQLHLDRMHMKHHVYHVSTVYSYCVRVKSYNASKLYYHSIIYSGAILMWFFHWVLTRVLTHTHFLTAWSRGIQLWNIAFQRGRKATCCGQISPWCEKKQQQLWMKNMMLWKMMVKTQETRTLVGVYNKSW